MSKENIESYFQSSIPGVFVNKVTLDTANERVKSPFNKNPHITEDFNDHTLANNSGLPNEETLKVTIDFNIKVAVRNGRARKDLFSSWIFNNYFVDYYRIQLLVVTDPEIYANLLNNPATMKDMNVATSNSSTKQKSDIVSLSELGIFNLTAEQDIEAYMKNFPSVQDGNLTIYDIPFSRKMEFDQIGPAHLSVFAIPYLDTEKIKEDLSVEEQDLDFIVGQPISELVIHEGNTSFEKRVFHQMATEKDFRDFVPTFEQQTPLGKIWVGPTHQLPDGSWRTGAFPGDLNDEELTVKQIKNNVVQDFRTMRKLEKKVFDYNVVENSKLGINSPNSSVILNDRLDVVRESSYFSQLFHSRDQVGQCRMFFSLDYLTLIKKNSVFPIVFEKSQPAEITNLLKSSIIRSFKLLRRRVEKSKKTGFINKLGVIEVNDFDKNEEVRLLAHTTDQVRPTSPTFKGGVFLRPEVNQIHLNDEEEEGEVEPETIATIREVDLLTPSSEIRTNYPYMRHFSGVDIEMSKITNGFYKYGIEIEIEDPSVNYMEGKLSELADLIKIYEEYYNLAIGLNKSQITKQSNQFAGGRPEYNFNSIAQKYIPEFLTELAESSAPLSSFALDITETQNPTSTIESHINKYMDILKLITQDDTSEDVKSLFIKSFLPMLSPVDGTPEGISTFIKLMNNLATNIERLLNSAISGPVTKTPANNESSLTSLNRFKVDSTRTFKIEKYFTDSEEIFNSDESKSLGLEYVTSYVLPESLTSDGDMGLVTINTGDYLQRILLETAKFFGQTDSKFTLPKELTPDIDDVEYSLTNEKYAYLAPSKAHIRETLNFDILKNGFDKTNNYYNSDKYNEIVMEALRYNEKLNIDKPAYTSAETSDASLSIGAQKVRANIIDIFSNRSCTINNMPSFFSETESQFKTDHCGDFKSISRVFREEVFSDTVPSVYSRRQTYLGDPMTWDFTNPNVLFSRIMSNLINYKLDLNNYNLFQEDTNEWFTQLETAPNQVKALYGAITLLAKLSKDPAFSPDMLLDFDKLKETLREPFGFFYMNFMNLAQVEVLSGYTVNEENGKNEAQMKKPIFRILNSDQWAALDNYDATNKLALRGLCRIQKYENPIFNINNIDALDIPIYNKHFFITRAPALSQIDSSESNAGIQSTPHQQTLSGTNLQTETPQTELASDNTSSSATDATGTIIDSGDTSENTGAAAATQTSTGTAIGSDIFVS